MDEQLKPCPFCGQAVDLVFNGHAGRSPTGKEWWIACGNDACLYLNGVQSYESASAVIRAWNTRPIEDALRSRVTELEERLAWYMTIDLNGNAVTEDALRAELDDLRRKWASVPWDTLAHLVAYPWAKQHIPYNETEMANWRIIFDWCAANAPE